MAKDVDVEELTLPVTGEPKVEAEKLEDEGLFETLYNKERKKSMVLLASTCVFFALFLIAVGFGLQASQQEAVGPRGMRGQFIHGSSQRQDTDRPFYSR
jgi:hypothetical protein